MRLGESPPIVSGGDATAKAKARAGVARAKARARVPQRIIRASVTTPDRRKSLRGTHGVLGVLTGYSGYSRLRDHTRQAEERLQIEDDLHDTALARVG